MLVTSSANLTTSSNILQRVRLEPLMTERKPPQATEALETSGPNILTKSEKSPSYWPPAVESSIAVEDAVENRGLYRVFVSRLFNGVSDTIAPLSRG